MSPRGTVEDAAGFTVWLTGLKGAGKGGIARIVAEELRRRGVRTELLSGGEFRQNISQGLGFSREDRIANIRRLGYFAKLLARNGVAVVASSISPYRETRDEVRREVGRFLEVFVDTPLSVCESRDTEGLYRRARTGELGDVTGISDPYEPPHDPDVVIRGDAETAAEGAARILDKLQALGWIPPARGGDPDEALVRAQLRALHNR